MTSRMHLVPLLALVAFACHPANGPQPQPTPSTTTTPKEIVVGDAAPTFTAPDLDGRPTSLARGKVHVVGFLATWSAPDKQSIPRLEAIHRRHRAEGVDVLAIAIDDDDTKGQIGPFFRENGATFPVVHDAGHRISTLFRVPCSPTYYVVDRAGVVRHRHCGYHDGEAEVIEHEAAALLGRAP